MSGLPASAAHVFVTDLDRPELDDDDAHHLARVLRLRDGESVTVGDGAGRWREARFRKGGLDPVGGIVAVAAPSPAIVIAFALIKGERPELVVQKLTELGVDEIVPFEADRCVVRWDDDRAGRHLARLRVVARQAAMQSRRVHLPTVSPRSVFTTVVARPGAVLASSGGDRPSLSRPVVLIGPEGGWTDDEQRGAPATMALGPTVLRAETAAIAAATLLIGLRNGLVAHHSA